MGKRGANKAPVTFGATLLAESKDSREASLPPGPRQTRYCQGALEGRNLMSTHPEGITCKSILQSSGLAPGAPLPQALAAHASLRCRPPPPNFGAPATLGSRADTRSALSPHWSRRS